MRTDRLLAAVLVMQGLTLAAAWTERPAPSSAAYGQIPNAGDQRQRLVDAVTLQTAELRALNAKLDKVVDALTNGKLQVSVAPPDEKRGGN